MLSAVGYQQYCCTRLEPTVLSQAAGIKVCQNRSSAAGSKDCQDKSAAAKIKGCQSKGQSASWLGYTSRVGSCADAGSSKTISSNYPDGNDWITKARPAGCFCYAINGVAQSVLLSSLAVFLLVVLVVCVVVVRGNADVALATTRQANLKLKCAGDKVLLRRVPPLLDQSELSALAGLVNLSEGFELVAGLPDLGESLELGAPVSDINLSVTGKASVQSPTDWK